MKYLISFLCCCIFSFSLVATEQWELEVSSENEAGDRIKQSLELEGNVLEVEVSERSKKDRRKGNKQEKKFELTDEEAAEFKKLLKSQLSTYLTNMKEDEKEHKREEGYVKIEISYESSEGNVEFAIEFMCKADDAHKPLFDLIEKYYSKLGEDGNL